MSKQGFGPPEMAVLRWVADSKPRGRIQGFAFGSLLLEKNGGIFYTRVEMSRRNQRANSLFVFGQQYWVCLF